MAKRQREWAKRALAQLVQDLGGRCVICGSTEALEIDHKYPSVEIVSFGKGRQDSSCRVIIMRREAKLGLLQVLCSDCNKKKGEPGEYVQGDMFTPLPSDEPF